MRLAILGAVLALIALILTLQIVKIADSGVEPLDLVSLLVITLFGVGIVGALRHPPGE